MTRPAHPRRFALRYSLPAGLFMVVLGMVALSYFDTMLNGTLGIKKDARNRSVLVAEHLARLTQRELRDHRDNVASDLAVATTDLHVHALALVNAQGVVELAQRLAWQGKVATAVLPGFDAGVFSKVVQGRLADVREAPDGSAFYILVPYLLEGLSGAVHDDSRGGVYLEYDLEPDFAQLRWDAQRRIWFMLLITSIATLGLARVLRKRVTEPLVRVEQASQRLARQQDIPMPLEANGPWEVAQLAHSFNLMATRIRDAQREVEASRERLAAIVDAAMDAIITVYADHRIQIANPAALVMFGAQRSDMAGQPLDRFIAQLPEGQTALLTGRRLSGEAFPAEASVSRIVVDAVPITIVMLRDATERQRAQKAILALNDSLEQQVEQRTAKLRETTLRLEQQQEILRTAHTEQRTIFETLTVGIALLKDGVIDRCNRKLEEIFACPTDHLTGQSARVWFAEEENFQNSRAIMERAMVQGQVFQSDQELVRLDGKRFWARITGRQLADSNLGNALLVVVEDMTLQRAAEQAIQEARERALDANRAKSDFLANMSHEIRTPMNAIIGLSYLLLKTDLQPYQRTQLGKIQNSSQLLLGIINDVLDYSKIEAGKLRIEHIDFELSKVLDNVTGLLADKVATKGLVLALELDPKLPAWLIGDPLRLSQILLNFADNAVKFTPAGKVTIRIDQREVAGGDILLHGSVSDTGIGLTAAQMDRLFQSFQQADSSTTREFGGTGLGLVICRQLAGLMGGEVGAHSEPGVGSTFWFTARLQCADRAPFVDSANPMAAPGEGDGAEAELDPDPLRAIRGARVLLVEDNALNREVACALLRDAGLTVDEAVNGAVALERLQQAHYELVLMDMQMPVMDGLHAARELRLWPDLKDLPVVAMTANAQASARQMCLDAGMNDLVLKPIEPALLFSALLHWIAPRHAAAEPPDFSPTLPGPLAPDPTEVPEVPGLDVRTGLRRVRGKKAFYVSLLRRFVQGQSGAIADLRGALYTGNRDDAQRIAHTLKGLAGSIGVAAIQRRAEELETAINDGQTLQMLEVSINSLERELMPFIAQLRERLTWHVLPGMEDDGPDPAVLAAVCRRLARLLGEDNLEALDVLSENEAALRHAFTDAFDRIDAEVRNFNCPTALLHLEQAALAHGLNLNLDRPGVLS